MSNKKASLTIDQHSYELPVHEGTLGPDVVDVSALQRATGLFTFDPGFKSTAACESKITFIDGSKGILLHRGYPIGQLAERKDHMDVCYLLLNGELPDESERRRFIGEIKHHTLVHEQMIQFLNGFRRDAHPMAIMVGVVGALSAFYHDALDVHNPEHRRLAALRLIAKMPTIAAMCYKYAMGQPIMYPDNNLAYTENFLHMMFNTQAEKHSFDPVIIKALDTIFILHADHEQNASTSTVRLAGSSGANPFACIAAGIGTLWGPAHGGANEACLNMLKAIGSEDNIQAYIEKAKDPNDPTRLMGFGHRVYKNYDPRAKIMRQTCHDVLQATQKQDDPLFKLAMQLEKIALEDPYFIDKKLYPNVDFYSGITLSALNIPSNMFTVIFALARTAGWISHWHEMLDDKHAALGRPRQLYTGHTQRDVPTEK